MNAGPLRTTAWALLIPLAGCVNMSGLSGESKYACAAPEGVTCNSVSGTYANALHNNLPSQKAGSARPSGTDSGVAAKEAPAASVSRDQLTGARTPTRQPISSPLTGHAALGQDRGSSLTLRSQARVLRLWTKPWEDADGDLWDQGFVYVQVDAGRWQIDHVRQRIRDQYTPLRPPPNAATSGPSAAASSTSTPDSSSPEVQAPSADGAVQRPFPAFPSLSRPPAGLGPRTQ